MMTTEFRVRPDGGVSIRGPYSTEGLAKHSKEVAEEVYGGKWLIEEREVTDWTEIPAFPPGDMGQLND